jgi:hypothetical protein
MEHKKATLEEMKLILESDNCQEMVDYLMTHYPESRDEMAMYQVIRDREYDLRKISTQETEKTKRLLSGSQRNKENK